MINGRLTHTARVSGDFGQFKEPDTNQTDDAQVLQRIAYFCGQRNLIIECICNPGPKNQCFYRHLNASGAFFVFSELKIYISIKTVAEYYKVHVWECKLRKYGSNRFGEIPNSEIRWTILKSKKLFLSLFSRP